MTSKNFVLAMEYCDGGSLYSMLDQPKYFYGLPEEEFLIVLYDIGKVTDSSHDLHSVFDVLLSHTARFNPWYIIAYSLWLTYDCLDILLDLVSHVIIIYGLQHNACLMQYLQVIENSLLLTMEIHCLAWLKSYHFWNHCVGALTSSIINVYLHSVAFSLSMWIKLRQLLAQRCFNSSLHFMVPINF